jgi:hypothetical protein
MSNPTTPFSWQMPTATDLVTDLPADFEVFGQAVATSMADLLGGTTGQVLSKTTNADMDFTWTTANPGDITAVNTTAPLQGGATSGAVTLSIDTATTAAVGAVQLTNSVASTSITTAAVPANVKTAYDLADAAIAKSTVTTAGDIIYRNATVPVRLGIGTAGQVLKVNSGATAPEWGAASAGAVTQITDTTLSSAAADITFSSIPSTYNHLMIIISGRCSSASVNGTDLLVQLNSDTATNYRHARNTKYGTAGATVTIEGGSNFTSMSLGNLWGGTASSNTISGAQMIFPNYKGTTLTKSMIFNGGCMTDAPGAGSGYAQWINFSAVTTIKIFSSGGNLDTGTRATLYGWT